MRISTTLLAAALALAATFTLSGTAGAQEAPDVILGAGGGGTFYSINTRADEGHVITGVAAYSPLDLLRFEVSVRRHGCFDCDGDFMVEGGPQLYLPGTTWQPYVGAGAGYCFGDSVVCDAATGFVSLGSWVWLGGDWGVRPDLRYRRVGSGDMGELSVAIGRRFPLAR